MRILPATASCMALSIGSQSLSGAGTGHCDTREGLCYHQCSHAPYLPRPSRIRNVLWSLPGCCRAAFANWRLLSS